MCKSPATDILVYEGVNRRRLCREHFLEEFKKEFLNFDQNMVVFYPALEFKAGPYVYQYRALDDVPGKYKDDKVGRMIVGALESISGRCGKCGGPANVAYFGSGSFRWEEAASTGEKWDLPRFEDMTVEPQILCRGCVANHLVYSLGNFHSQFQEGVVLPYKGKGVMLPGAV